MLTLTSKQAVSVDLALELAIMTATADLPHIQDDPKQQQSIQDHIDYWKTLQSDLNKILKQEK